MKRVFLVIGILAVALCGAAEAAAQRADPEKVRLARKFCDALNADAYAVRVKARDSLMKLGRAAIEPLEFAAKSEESETRLHAVELLIALRGRGLMGIGMLDARMGDVLPEWGAGVKSLDARYPAGKAGLQTGDVIIALNDEPVEDNNALQSQVFAAGPARLMDVLVERGSEKLRFSVLLTLNLTSSVYSTQLSSPSLPPVDLERELPESEDPKGREEARVSVNAPGMVVFNGQVIQNAIPPQPAKPIDENINLQQLEAEFERVKAEAEKEKTPPNANANASK